MNGPRMAGVWCVLGFSEKRFPALALVLVQVSLREMPTDGGEAHGETQLFEFSLDLSGAPIVLLRESTNGSLHFDWDRMSSETGPRNESPIQSESVAVPADDRFGLDDDQDLFSI